MPLSAKNTEQPSTQPTPKLIRVGVHASVNSAAAIDAQIGSFYAFASVNPAPFLLPGPGVKGSFAAGAGVSFQLASTSAATWRFDLFGLVAPAAALNWFEDQHENLVEQYVPLVGLGVGVGFRYEHHSGFVFGLKVPVAGVASGAGGGYPDPMQLVTRYYIASLFGMPIISFGYRF